jgi:peptide/nickel transport system permease protein
MITYFLRRTLLAVPTLLVVSFLVFMLSRQTPGDPVLALQQGSGTATSDYASVELQDQAYRKTASFLGLDKPQFYFSLLPTAYPDSLYRFLYPDKKRALKGLIAQFGNWPRIEAYHQTLVHTERVTYQLPDSLAPNALQAVRTTLRLLHNHYQPERIEASLQDIHDQIAGVPQLSEPLQALRAAWDAVVADQKVYRNWIPAFRWYGADNQYHHWISGVLQGDWGKSYLDGSNVSTKIAGALRWTLTLNGAAILIAYLLAVPLGVYMAVHAGKKRDQALNVLLFMLYSLPGFWIATLLIVFLTHPEYGMDWFPALGYPPYDPGRSKWEAFWLSSYHLILPVFCLTYGSLAYIARQMRGSMVKVLRQPYIQTAYAKGLPKRAVIWKHAFKNALFPIITLFAGVFPAAISGSFVVEYIFSIPGMGKLTVDAIMAKDWPLVYGILMLGALLTIAGILMADILYTLADPRVGFAKKQKT